MYLEDYKIGDKYKVKAEKVDLNDMIEFAKKYDKRDFHISKEAAENSRFKKIIASGFYTLCFAWGNWVKTGKDSDGMIAGIGVDNLLWKKPVYVGDSLSSVLTVTDVDPSDTKDVGTVYVHYETKNQNDEVVMVADLKYLVKKKEQ
ncbi:MAG: MaoC/PaaZ C-terminal domain-containing protein [Tissierellia bacterium]|nr:MaoC/PaaZ C-terminal domain-containing protein [Tissierellia bacterium]